MKIISIVKSTTKSGEVHYFNDYMDASLYAQISGNPFQYKMEKVEVYYDEEHYTSEMSFDHYYEIGPDMEQGNELVIEKIHYKYDWIKLHLRDKIHEDTKSQPQEHNQHPTFFAEQKRRAEEAKRLRSLQNFDEPDFIQAARLAGDAQ